MSTLPPAVLERIVAESLAAPEAVLRGCRSSNGCSKEMQRHESRNSE